MIKIIYSEKGKLSEIDLTNLPFVPKRFFIVDNVKVGDYRADHAHLKDQQYLICLNGSLKIFITGKDLITKEILLHQTDSLLLPTLTWCKIYFIEPESSFVCMCSETHDESEYIRDYNKFIQIIQDQK